MNEEEKLYGNVPLGEPFKYKGKVYIPVLTKTIMRCHVCDLFRKCGTNYDGGVSELACFECERDDEKTCIFKLVENG